MAADCPVATFATGGLTVSKYTSNVMPVPAPLQESVALVATLVAPLAGLGLLGAAGGATIVVKDHTLPAVWPPALIATTFQ